MSSRLGFGPTRLHASPVFARKSLGEFTRRRPRSVVHAGKGRTRGFASSSATYRFTAKHGTSGPREPRRDPLNLVQHQGPGELIDEPQSGVI